MDMYQKRKIRQEKKKSESNQESFSKTSINWYPGHMAKTKRKIIEDLKLIDVVVEVLDARIPKSSQNPDLNQFIKDKKKIVILNKSDLADEKINNEWKKYFESKGIPAVITDSSSGKGIEQTVKAIEKVYKEEQEKYEAKGRTGKSIRILILGIPNVGKSSYINKMAKKNIAQVGNKPGVTRQKQWIRVGQTIELLDTPGVLWPKFDNEEVALHLAYTGTIKDDVLDKIEVAYQLTKFLLENYMDNLIERFKLNKEEVEEELSNEDIMENERILNIMYMIGRKRGAIVSGGRVDEEKTSNIIIDDFRTGKIGNISLERPNE